MGLLLSLPVCTIDFGKFMRESISMTKVLDFKLSCRKDLWFLYLEKNKKGIRNQISCFSQVTFYLKRFSGKYSWSMLSFVMILLLREDKFGFNSAFLQ